MIVKPSFPAVVGGPQEERWRKLTGDWKESICCCWGWDGLGRHTWRAASSATQSVDNVDIQIFIIAVFVPPVAVIVTSVAQLPAKGQVPAAPQVMAASCRSCQHRTALPVDRVSRRFIIVLSLKLFRYYRGWVELGDPHLRLLHSRDSLQCDL